MRHLLQFLLAWLIACALSPALAQASRQFTGSRELLLAGDFAALERLYPIGPGPVAHDYQDEMPSVRFFQSLELGLIADHWPREDKATQAWLERSPGSVPAALARAKLLATRAVAFDAARQWAEVDTAVREMEQLLMAVQPKAARDMQWHALHVALGQYQGWPPARVRSAIEAGLDVDATSLYFYQMAAAVLSPEWRGSAAPLEWLARQGAARTASQGATTYAFARMWTAESIEAVHSRPFEAGLMDWSLMNPGLTELFRRTGSAFQMNEHAALACRAGDKVTTARLIGRIGATQIPDAWKRWGGVSHYENCKGWAEAGSVKT